MNHTNHFLQENAKCFLNVRSFCFGFLKINPKPNLNPFVRQIRHLGFRKLWWGGSVFDSVFCLHLQLAHGEFNTSLSSTLAQEVEQSSTNQRFDSPGCYSQLGLVCLNNIINPKLLPALPSLCKRVWKGYIYTIEYPPQLVIHVSFLLSLY